MADWHKTHMNVGHAAKVIGVSESVLRSIIARGKLDFDPQPDRNGRMMKLLRRDDVEGLRSLLNAKNAPTV
jgi:hypothetical protein